jgi:hypothetical protein
MEIILTFLLVCILGNNKFSDIRYCFYIICFLFVSTHVVSAQDATLKKDSVPVEDVGDFARKLFHKKIDSAKAAKPPKLAILPSIGYNPSFGALIGAKVSGVKQFGDPEVTKLSAFGIEALITSKGVITLQARHNIFRDANKWNIQGNWQFSKYLISDYGIGTGIKNDSAYPIKFNFIRLSEAFYRKIGKNLYAGPGITFNIRAKIDDEKLETLGSTPHEEYSLRNGFNPREYSSNGFFLGMEYNTREHPLRPYGGEYGEIIFRFNPEWLGSTKESIQFYYDLRKYIGLSIENPEHVLAIWFIGSFRLGGTIPYLELPATGYDMYNRSGRAYTIGRFKGPSYTYYETEYRYPITRNKLLSGVAFFNLQSASDDLGKKIFQYWEPGGGAGLRVLLQKKSRSTICFDYAIGRYGSNGFFFGLNEAF